MDRYKVAIVDDDELSLDNLAFGLQKFEDFHVEGTARNGASGKKLIAKVHPDLLFLDVELPDMRGMDLLDSIRESLTWDMKVVFYTAYDKYMVSAIRQSAFDYLLKPFEEEELELIISRFMKRIELERKAVSFPSALVNTSQTFMVFTPTNDMRALRPAEIGYFRYCSERKQWEVVLSGQAPLPLKKSTTAEQIVKYAPCFVQIHQSFIINIDYLMIIKDSKCVLYPPFENVSELLVSKKFKKELQDRYCL
ncbi:LytTR family DNA-binding domain-containing protein [Bacteroides stercorirosoris]|jgi:two-component system LytT family response regulator|uniref:DNA-binding response regulator n=1 Tax=Bacteroides stercorirosoris TaxID=871324 RepID=A0A1M6E2F0_9BACE|nr:LytTR family DNA-binding domain-containing protein [Bacteroides stercorirosoris]OKZ07361.1 MAG: DNA-binding response regulator [Bacteroides oleiciplenus]RGX78709.1 DNA-binding response regulator [Bacteroides stercorirosoris]SHI79565.1 two component transcriptional regulator, LytTR family [Bacteroides stercorirosoris]